MKHSKTFRTSRLLCGAVLAITIAGPLTAGAEPPVPKVPVGLRVQAESAKAAADAAGKAAAEDNTKAAPGGPAPAIPGVQPSRGAASTGAAGQAGAAATVPTMSSPASEARAKVAESLPGTAAQQKSGFLQGASKPTLDTNAGAGMGGNPVNSLTGGSIGGQAGAAAGSGTGTSGIAGQGTGAISDGGPLSSTGALRFTADGEVIGPGRNQTAIDKAKQFGVTEGGVNKVVGSDTHAEQMKCALDESKCGEAPAASEAATAKPDKVTTSDDGKGGQTTIHERKDGSSTTIHKHDDGSYDIFNTAADGTVTKESYDANNKPVTPREDARFRPSPEEFLRNRQSDRNVQIKAAAKADAAVNPDRSDSASGARLPGAAAPSQSATGQFLFGQPNRVGESAGSGSGRLDFNGNLGAVDPGPDATVNAGNRQQDPGAVFGSAPSPGFPATRCDRDHRTVSTADDCPKP